MRIARTVALDTHAMLIMNRMSHEVFNHVIVILKR